MSSILKNQLEESKTIEELINDDSVVLAKQVVLFLKFQKYKCDTSFLLSLITLL
jgi:hypothetical protein